MTTRDGKPRQSAPGETMGTAMARLFGRKADDGKAVPAANPGSEHPRVRWDYARCTCADVELFAPDRSGDMATAEALRRLRARMGRRLLSASRWFPQSSGRGGVTGPGGHNAISLPDYPVYGIPSAIAAAAALPATPSGRGWAARRRATAARSGIEAQDPGPLQHPDGGEARAAEKE